MSNLGHAEEAKPNDEAVRQILQTRIETEKRGVGVVVGIVDEHGKRVIAFGRAAQDGGGPLNGQTLFEIGSISKVFTSLLLADMVGKGEVKLDDPVAKYLPPETKVPTRNGRQITLLDLSTHRSGLPRMPDNFTPRDPGNPYADYSLAQMFAFLSGYTLTRDIGSQYEYSNFGAALLGQALAHRAGTTYETLLNERICRPLGMKNTFITLPAQARTRLAAPHNEDLTPAKNWDLGVFAGAGGILSDADDMLVFLEAALGRAQTPLAAALDLTGQPRNSAGGPHMDIGLGWHINKEHEPPLIWHSGATGGYRSFAGFSPARRCGVVLLSNTGNAVDDIALHLLDARFPLDAHPPLATRQAERDDPYVGNYALAANFVMTISRLGDRYFVQATGQGKNEAFVKSPTEFFFKVVDAQLSFEEQKQGRYQSLVLHQNGHDQKGLRLDAAAPLPVIKERKVIVIKGEIGDKYVGRYELAPGAVFAVTREGDRYFAQLTGQPKVEIFPETERDFFYRIVDAQLSFVPDETGKVGSLILHQNGDHPAKRLP